MSQWIGQTVSVECFNVGVYQGVVSNVDSDTSTVTLKKVFKNGKPCEQNSVSILASQIKNLSFIDSSKLALATPLNKTKARASNNVVVESSDDDRDSSTRRMKPARVVRANTVTQTAVKAEEPKQRRRSNSFTMADSNSHIASRGYQNSPKRTEHPQHRNNRHHQHRHPEQAECFNVSVESCMGDFDFEKNLAMFDKQRVFNDIENGPGSRTTPKKPGEDKYKHDEMVIKPNKAVRQIKMMDSGLSTSNFITDDGLVIPCVSYPVRQQLFEKADSYGFTEQRRSDIVGRNTSDMVFQLIGGSNRLNPQNTHQKPTVVVFCGPHIQGSYGVSCARHLANHNISTVVYTPPMTSHSRCALLEQEVALYDLSGCKRINSTDDLPTNSIDLIINCLDSPDTSNLSGYPWYKYITNWCNTSRAHVLAIDPLPTGCVIETKWSVHIALPQQTDNTCGQAYLCDISLPKELFKHIGIKYRSPFGIKFCIPIHRET